LSQALTHKSFKHGRVPSNERLQYVGRRSLEYFTVEANMNAKAADLQNKVLEALDTQQLATKFDVLGLESGVQCHLVK
jgi:dsRNA-specific ribonuclease